MIRDGDNTFSWEGDKPVDLDLYYDPVLDEHVGNGPIGIIAPTWYFATQRRAVAEAGWQMTAMLSGALGGEPLSGFDNPDRTTMLLQVAGEFADPATKKRIWEAAESWRVGFAMHVCAHPQNAAESGKRTSFYLSNISSSKGWVMSLPTREYVELRPDLQPDTHRVKVEVVVNNEACVIRQK